MITGIEQIVLLFKIILALMLKLVLLVNVLEVVYLGIISISKKISKKLEKIKPKVFLVNFLW